MLRLLDHAHTTQKDIDIVYYVATFISRSVEKTVACIAFGDILGDISAL